MVAVVTAKPEQPLKIEERVDVVERLQASHNNLGMPWLPSLYSDAADEIIRLRKELYNP